MDKHRILYIDDWGVWGGAEKVTLTLVKGLDKRRFEPHFILGCEGLFAQALRNEGIPVHIVPMAPMTLSDSQKAHFYWFGPKFVWRLGIHIWKAYFVARHIRPQLIHTCSIQAKLVGSFVAKLLRVKLIWHVHNIQPAGFRRGIVRLLIRLRFPDKIVTVSQAVAGVYQDIVPDGKIEVNHNGINLVEFEHIDVELARKSLRSEFGLQNEKMVVNASMIKRWKGPHIFIRAAAEVLRKMPETVLFLVGEAQFEKDREFEKQLVALVDELNLAEKIRFLGFRKDVYNIIAAADCLVHCPVENDPFPTVVLEAMAAQTPIVGTAVGGVPEQVQREVSGLLVEPGNERQLAEAIIRILAEPDLARRLARAARKKVETEFTLQQYVGGFERIYAQLLED